MATHRPSRPVYATLIGVAALAYVLDQGSKLWAQRALADGHTQDLVGSFLRLRLTANPGAAFNMGSGSTWVMTLIAAVILVVIVRFSRRLGSRSWAVTLGLLLGGALGNLTDRIIQPPGPFRGHVIDFIDYNGWFIGNVADIAIVLGAALVAWLTLRDIGLEAQVARRESVKPFWQP